MTPLEKFGAKVFSAWFDTDCMDVEGCAIQDMAESTGMIVMVPYQIAEHGEIYRDAWDYEEGQDLAWNAPGVGAAVRRADSPDTIWGMLSEIYEEDDRNTFLITEQADILGGKSPAQVLAEGDLEGINALHSWLHGCLYQVAT